MIRLSVVVTIVDGGPTLERLLDALSAQQGVAGLEVLVPWDESLPGIPAIASRFPQFRFVPLGTLSTFRPLHRPAGQHELFDRRRAAGLAQASGELVAILEDRGVPGPNWARAAIAAHERMPHAVIGGAVENGRDRTLNWAVYFCDFGRYQRPFEAGAREYVSDVNICYKRRALEQTRELWKDRYHETTVHWALQRAGETLYLTPEFSVEQMRYGLTLCGVMAERIGWGRLFACTRSREIVLGRRLTLAALSPVLPLVLFTRLMRDRLRRGHHLASFVTAAPAVLLLLAGWSLGECMGYLTGRP